MLDLIFTNQFKKDYKLCQKRNYNMELIQNIINTLSIPAPLETKHRSHFLTGNYANKMECHILPDWLLIYRITENTLTLYRTGTHSDLFGK